LLTTETPGIEMTKTVLLAILLASSSIASEMSVFKNTDVFELEVAADPQISPDGSRIAYVRRSMDIMTDRAVSNIWIIETDGANHRPLLAGADNFSQPRWSPSGDRIAYVTSKEGRGAQLHVLWLDSGQTAMLTNVRHSPSSISWSPDGKMVAFEMFVAAGPKPLVEPPKAPEGLMKCRTAGTGKVISKAAIHTCLFCRRKAVRRGSSAMVTSITTARLPGPLTAATSFSPPTGSRTRSTIRSNLNYGR
jgi:hypothetical protein